MAEQRVSDLCNRVINAKTVLGGADELLCAELGGLFEGLHKLHIEYIEYVKGWTKMYGKPFLGSLDNCIA